MSLKKFSEGIKSRAAQAALTRLVTSSVSAYRSKDPLVSAASILNADARELRTLGKSGAYTNLVVTEDNLVELLQFYGVYGLTEKGAMNLYLEFLNQDSGENKVKFYEFYDSEGNLIPHKNIDTPLGKIIPKLNRPVLAVRGLNFTHTNTLIHMTKFLMYLGVTSLKNMSLQDAASTVGQYYQRGHILAVSTARQAISVGNPEEEITALDKLVELSRELDYATSSLGKPNKKYKTLEANINKDFSTNGIYMNIELQLERDPLTGKGNQDSNDITKTLQIVSHLRKMISNVNIDSRGRLGGIKGDPYPANAATVVAQIQALVGKIEAKRDQIVKLLDGYVDNASEYVTDIESSRSIKQHVVQAISDSLTGKDLTITKVSHKGVSIPTGIRNAEATVSKLAPITKNFANTKKAELKRIASLSKKTTPRRPVSSSLVSLQGILNADLVRQVKQNMGDGSRKDILNLRTGRFAESVRVDRLSESRAGMITVFYNYMKNPYATFSSGGAQSRPASRDPKLLISKSIRELISPRVSNRLRSVLV